MIITENIPTIDKLIGFDEFIGEYNALIKEHNKKNKKNKRKPIYRQLLNYYIKADKINAYNVFGQLCFEKPVTIEIEFNAPGPKAQLEASKK